MELADSPRTEMEDADNADIDVINEELLLLSCVLILLKWSWLFNLDQYYVYYTYDL